MQNRRAPKKIRLGVNIDHVATLRRLRDAPYPDILEAARECVAGGADQITVHLREDRRHIVDEDVLRLRKGLKVDLNLEMAATDEMLKFALEIKPHSICLVPEKREERTTEGGLNIKDRKTSDKLKRIAAAAREAGIISSFFIEPDPQDVALSKELGADAVELHTGSLCIAHQTDMKANLAQEWKRLHAAVEKGKELGLLVHAGHGIDYKIASELAATDGIIEYNIGHSIVCEAVFSGLREATRKMKALVNKP
jgi:pyridoxine 5-phosphate synthase